MTVLEVIQRSADFLARKGVESPRLQAELLLARLLEVPRLQLYLNFERTLSAGELDAVRRLIQRRAQREPLQHILGTTSFCGLEMIVNRHVLVPRPETELLAETGWEFLRGRIGSNLEQSSSNPPGAGLSSGFPLALDFGTGSGCIAIALAVKCPAACVLAVDVSPEALSVAKANAKSNLVGDRIEFFHGAGFAPLPPDCHFDLIISNPPYIPGGEIDALEPEVREFDPRAALDGGVDGLDFYRLFAAQAAGRLRPGGRLMLEFGDGQGASVQALLVAAGWVVEVIRADLTGCERVMVARRG